MSTLLEIDGRPRGHPRTLNGIMKKVNLLKIKEKIVNSQNDTEKSSDHTPMMQHYERVTF